MSTLHWTDEAFASDNRRVALCGNVAIGAIFLPLHQRGRYIRWRIWCSVNMNPAEGVAQSPEAAKREVEERFERFLNLADLAPAPKVKP